MTTASTTYARMRRYRQRIRDGVTFAHVEVSRSIGESMIEMGYLSDSETHSPKEIGEAFVRFWKEQYIRKSR